MKEKYGYCTHIGNKLFAWFQSTNSKSRVNFLELLRTGRMDYVINDDALEYMGNQRLAKSIIHLLEYHYKKQFADLSEWQDHLQELQIVNHRHIRIATEGALLGSVLYHGLPKSLVSSVMMRDSLISSPMPFVGFMQSAALISSLHQVRKNGKSSKKSENKSGTSTMISRAITQLHAPKEIVM
ncbi:MAG: hypothetical protein U9R17_17600 [Thermodesulfobacteriota bacterium]|nr:hypothetical protein [Thermodesulfobacteriota bacterium]